LTLVNVIRDTGIEYDVLPTGEDEPDVKSSNPSLSVSMSSVIKWWCPCLSEVADINTIFSSPSRDRLEEAREIDVPGASE
jgi:hypothetical protein